MDCGQVTVDAPGGNGLLLSRYVRGARIARSEFKWVGDSAIVMLGSTMDTQPCNGSNGDQPRGTQIGERCQRQLPANVIVQCTRCVVSVTRISSRADWDSACALDATCRGVLHP